MTEIMERSNDVQNTHTVVDVELQQSDAVVKTEPQETNTEVKREPPEPQKELDAAMEQSNSVVKIEPLPQITELRYVVATPLIRPEKDPDKGNCVWLFSHFERHINTVRHIIFVITLNVKNMELFGRIY